LISVSDVAVNVFVFVFLSSFNKNADYALSNFVPVSFNVIPDVSLTSVFTTVVT